MKRIRSSDAEIAYEVLGNGPPVILLHPFPTNHEMWLPAIQPLISRFRLVLPDLRGHGDSELGEGPALMEKHAADIARIMDDAEIRRAPLAGNSIGGYAIFEFWRRFRERVSGLVLCNTKPQADTPEEPQHSIAGRRQRFGSGNGAIFRKPADPPIRENYSIFPTRFGRGRVAHDAKDVRRKRRHGATWNGRPPGFPRDLENN